MHDEHEADPTGAHALALYVINTGQGYDNRCACARLRDGRAFAFGRIAEDGARRYDREFSALHQRAFNPATILLAASELAAYYARHVAETDALAAAEAKS